ncbi:hypothetical protein NEUTE1DRAFT_116183 [Neurospora tetrasperma FGSC 2508]|uniref:BTB domain-containing protein n=1 Tax=Neurospora tetrasperma (strain FGSC 2508 / ATCC MYA-4615 / P0657) TaxID=510951 RepID=F8MEN4_NEUT8|nr:uncharacterized protein NEUTE1DRAFT_116183 [Neurospora tetrasperma FGSC 2508]EGO61663.1 hypothetical protein NEUTE1DRAFT_116183 [Neurospora tetrasperma FGSC 2508]EGZ74287.1 hypothetical protein NEUTE2DRAFT_143303 [Neurospora tetrasperma FGSC 2509]
MLTTTHSPYASPACNLPFASPMVVALDVLKNKAPKLYAAYDSQSPELPTVSEEIGHVIVHYLYTNKYESLKPVGADKLAKQIVELKTAIKVYVLARAYELPDLVRLAERNIEKFGDGMALPTLLEVASDAYPSLVDTDQWFIGYLKKRIRLHLNDASSLLGTDLLNRLSHILSPNKILLRIVLEVCCEQMTNPKQGLASPITTAESSRATSRTRDVSQDESKQSPLAEEATPEVKALEVEAEPEQAQVEVNRAPSELEAETVPESEVVAAVVPKSETKAELHGRDRKDSGKELSDELPITLSTEPVIKELDAASHDLPFRPRVNREADSGFWEPTTPGEAEASKRHSFLELQSAPGVSELSAESEEDAKQDKGKAVDAETEAANQYLHLSAIPESGETVVESTTEDALKISQEAAVEEDAEPQTTEKAETTPADNEVDSSDVPEQQLSDAAAERQDEAQHEHESSPIALRDAAKSVVSFAVSDDQKAEFGVLQEPRTVGADAETKSTAGDRTGAEPAESALVSAPKVSSKIDVSDKTEELNGAVHPGMNPRSKSWKRRLSMRVPVLFGRGM